MIEHSTMDEIQLRRMLKNGNISFGGNKNLKIYGLLSCRSGKRMKRQNRVFFKTGEEAQSLGYRPCGHCMRELYQLWNYSIEK